MTISSLAFTQNTKIPKSYTCDGEGKSPALVFADIPEGTMSLALIVDDPDAPQGTWVHWTVWNIDPATHEIPEGTVPVGAIQGITDFGKPGYGGPCPPSGTHRYFFKLYALDKEFALSHSVTKADLEQAMEGHILAQAELVGMYSR